MKQRLSLLLVLVLLTLSGFAQQRVIDPATTSGVFGMTSLAHLSSDVIVSGSNGDGAVIGRMGASSMAWAKLLNLDSRFESMVTTSNGEYVAVGFHGGDLLATRFDQLGNIAWTKVFGVDTLTESFRGVTVDPSGNIIAVGVMTDASYIRSEIIVKMSSAGNVIWSSKLQSMGVNTFADRVFVKNDSIFVFGSTFNNSYDPFVAVFGLSTGDLLSYKALGTAGMEMIGDVVEYQGGFLLSYFSSGVTRLMKIDGSLSVVDAYEIVPPSGWYLLNGYVSTDGSDIFISGFASGTSVDVSGYASYVLAIDQSFTPLWGMKVSPRSYSVRISVDGPLVTTLDVQNQTTIGSIAGSVLTKLDKATGQAVSSDYCEPPVPFSFTVGGISISQTPMTRVAVPLAFNVFGTDTFVPYAPIVSDCEPFVMPVELVSFTGEKEENAVRLSWATATESNNDYFTIFRSSDTSMGDEVGTVKGVGNSQSLTSYELVDENPLQGWNYYYLRQTDNDGSFHDMGPVAVYFDGVRLEISAFPNPQASNESFTVSGLSGQVLVFDELGRNIPFTIVGDKLTINGPAGSYHLTSVSPKGEASSVRLVTF